MVKLQFQVGDTVRHITEHRDHARRYFDGADQLVIRKVGAYDGRNTLYFMEGFDDDRFRVCEHRLELVEPIGGPW